MLRQVYILKEETMLYNKKFGKSISPEDFQKLVQEIIEEAKKGTNLVFTSKKSCFNVYFHNGC